MDTETQPIGGAITLRVFPGDTLRSKVYAKYEDNSDGTTEVLPTLASFLATAYGMPVGGEGVSNIFEVLDQSTTGIIGVKDDFDESQPDIYLNYLLYDDDFNLVDFGIDPISTNAEIPADPTAMTTHAFDELANEIIVEKPGFVYIYISNEDERNITAYFDDFEVKHTYGNIAVAKDQYPFGLAMEGRKLERKYWRYGYQGEYAEKDDETQWNAFQLRQFDPVIGRWTTTDPYGQYPSPYLGMGNNPVMRLDPDGGFDYYQNEDGHTVWVNSSNATWTDSNGEVYQNIGTEYLNFNGEFISFHGQTDFGTHLKPWTVIIPAVSGRPQSDGSFDYSFSNQFNKGSGQLPEGSYWVNPQKIQDWNDLSIPNQLASYVGRGAMPGGPNSWGEQRVWINPQEVHLRTPEGDQVVRNGFSIHGGSTPGSAGCIDCHKNAPIFFKLLDRSTATKVFLNVHYGMQK